MARAFPCWATIPGGQWLAMARHWHFFFAWIFVVNGVAYLLYTIFSRHLKKDLVPTREELRNIGRSIVDHLKFKHPTGAAATRYNVLQSLTYLIVIFGLLPLVVFAGLAMSPRLDTVFTGWVDLLGGRQSARTLHFLAAFGLLLFVVVHVAEVFIAGVWNEMRSMITGWYAVPAGPREEGGAAMKQDLHPDARPAARPPPPAARRGRRRRRRRCSPAATGCRRTSRSSTR